MRLADDDRARVPFALVGVLLLVGSSTFAASLVTPGPSPVDRSADVAAERVDAEVTAALRTAVRDAARGAAREPVTTAADTDAGTGLEGPDTFRRYLRLRIFLAARDAVEPVEHRRGESVASASLGESVGAVRGALKRVSISGVDEGTALRATVHGIEIEIEHDGRVLDTRRVNRTVTVGVPVLALHDRTVAFQARLDANPIESPGLARRMTVGITAMAQARGLAQYGGLPVSNVVANRHVALSANAGLLDAQRAAFGRSDPEAAAGVRAATLRTGVADILAPRTDSRVVSAVTGRLPDPNAPERTTRESGSGALPATRTIDVGVNGTADEAFLSLLRGESGDESVDSLRRDGYRADVSVSTDARTVRDESRPSPRPPGENWTLAAADVSTEVTVEGGGRAGLGPRDGAERRRLYSATRRVIEHRTIERRWIKVNETPQTTTASWRDVHRVRVIASGRLHESPAPTRPVSPLFESGGALDGPNLREGRAKGRALVADLGGPDAIARKAVTGGRQSASATITGDRPTGLEPWIYEDLSRLRDRVRDLSVEVDASDAATGRTNGAARLAALLRERRSALVDAPRQYDGVADRTRVAAREVYIDRVIDRLDARADRTESRNSGIGRALDAAGVTQRRANRLADLTPQPAAPRTEFGSESGIRGETTLVPDGDPAYLDPGPVDGAVVDGVAHDEQYVGLAVRNLNVFAVPYGESADLVTRTLLGDPGRVSLHTAGGALVAADRALESHSDATLRSRRDALEPKVEDSMAGVERVAKRTLKRETSLTREARAAVVRQALARYDGPGRRAMAAANGSLASTMASIAAPELAVRSETPKAIAEDRVRTALRVDLHRVATSDRVRVSQAAVEDAVSATRKVTEHEADDVAETATEKAIAGATGRKVRGIPAGLPISPTLSPWIATTNVWVVEARGAYGRFAVRTESGSTTYVRDGTSVALDIDDDGSAERLGRSDRIDFSVRSVAVVAVPSGGLGVGDTDGNVDERSVAWSDPEPGARCLTPTGECTRE